MNHHSPSFSGLRVAAFESRRAAEMARLIERHGGSATVSPSLREVPLEDQREVIDFAHLLLTGEVDTVVFLTGVGFRQLLNVVVRHVDRQRFLNTLSDVVTIARGPKPVAAMREVGLTPTFRVPEPNTWRELLQTIDASVPIANQTVALQEYGITNPSLIAGLEARGARVLRLQVYRWELPEDTGPLRNSIQAFAEGRLDVLLFTSAIQVTHVVQIADQMGLSEQVSERLNQAVIGSVGPATSEALREYGWPVDVQPEHPKMGALVAAAAERSRAILDRKQRLRIRPVAPSPTEDRQAAWYDSPFMKACRREPCDVVPVWLMRQAGRYMAEYREVRAKTTFLDLCKNPALCSEVMCTAVQRLGVDAAIIFSDLLPILEPMGLDLEFAQGEGPVIHNPVREGAEVDRVLELESVDSLHFVRDRSADAARSAAASALDRLRRSAVYLGQLRDRRRFQPELSPYQDLDVPRCRSLADADGTLCSCRDPVPERPDRCRCAMRPNLRFVGRVPRSRRLPPAGASLRLPNHRWHHTGCAGDQLCRR